MRKKVIGAVLLLLMLSAGVLLWARSALTGDSVRTALAAQLSTAIGQPVSVGSIHAAVYPRLSVVLGDVAIGTPPRIRVRDLRVGTDFRGLLSRRIEHATLDLSGARVNLPLPTFTLGRATTPGDAGPTAMELVSIDRIALDDIEVVSGRRTLTGNVELVPEGAGVLVRTLTLGADGQTITITGRIKELSGPTGDLTLESDALNFDQLLAFVTDFAAGSGLVASPGIASPADAPRATAASPPSVPLNLAITIRAASASMGALSLEGLNATARLTPAAMTLDPTEFQVFGGRYTGSLAFTLADVPGFTVNAALSGVDLGAAMAFAGSPGLMTGRLSAKLAMTGRGLDAATVMAGARGTTRIDVTDGVVKNLGLLRSVVVATSGRDGAGGAIADLGNTRDEPFTRLGATLQIGGGSAATQDLRFESANLSMTTAGVIRLDGSQLDLAGNLQLSPELSKQAGRDLVRYTQEGGRVTIPVTITGSADAPQVRPDVADMAKRALKNRATEEVQKTLKERLGGIFRR